MVIRSHIREQVVPRWKCDGNCFIISFRSAEKAFILRCKHTAVAGSCSSVCRHTLRDRWGEPGKSDASSAIPATGLLVMCMVAGPNRIALFRRGEGTAYQRPFQQEHNLLALSPQDEILLRGLLISSIRTGRNPDSISTTIVRRWP